MYLLEWPDGHLHDNLALHHEFHVTEALWPPEGLRSNLRVSISKHFPVGGGRGVFQTYPSTECVLRQICVPFTISLTHSSCLWFSHSFFSCSSTHSHRFIQSFFLFITCIFTFHSHSYERSHRMTPLHLFTHSHCHWPWFIHSFIHAHIHSFTYLFTHSHVHSLTLLSLLFHSSTLIHSFTPSIPHSHAHSLIHSLPVPIHSFCCS